MRREKHEAGVAGGEGGTGTKVASKQLNKKTKPECVLVSAQDLGAAVAEAA